MTGLCETGMRMDRHMTIGVRRVFTGPIWHSRLIGLACALVAAVGLAVPAGAFDGTPNSDNRSPIQAFREGAAALKTGNGTEAVRSLQYAADQGHLASAWKLGRMYADGDGVRKNDLKAFEMFRKITAERADETPGSSSAGYVANAFITLANYMLEGIPGTYVKADPERAFEFYQYAASYFGDPEGQYRLARLYLDGVGTHRDPQQAARWLSLAVKKSHWRAQAVLGHMLFLGRDVPRRAPYGLMLLTLAKEAAAGPDEVWIGSMYQEAMSNATDGEREKALGLMENWLKSAAVR